MQMVFVKLSSNSICKASVPAKIMATHLVEPVVEGSVKLPKFLKDICWNSRVSPTLGFSKASWSTAALRLLQTWEALSLVEVEVLVADNTLETQEVLYATHLTGWVAH